MVQVGSPQLPGYGAQAAPKPGYQDSPYENFPGNGNGAGPAPSAPFVPKGTMGIPNNFWGFVMIVMGMR
jgi:hypothetical protein